MIPVRLAFLVMFLCVTCLVRLEAHGTEVVGGEVKHGGNGTVILLLDLVPRHLALLSKMPVELTTWGAVRQVEPQITATLRQGLALDCAGGAQDPAEARITALAGVYPPMDALGLPDRVLVRVEWRQVPPGPWVIRERFALDNTQVTLVITYPDPSTETASETRLPGTIWGTLFTALVIGIEHIVPGGLDHILFVLGLYAAARCRRDLLIQVTSFTVAHCLTLGLAMGGVIVLGPRWSIAVEIAIAASIVAVAFENLRRPQVLGWRRLSLVTAFGLVHGLGFSGALSQVAWPEGRFLPALLAANLGIEIGQILMLCAAALVTAWWWSLPWYHLRIALPLSLTLGLTGMLWTIQRIVHGG